MGRHTLKDVLDCLPKSTVTVKSDSQGERVIVSGGHSRIYIPTYGKGAGFYFTQPNPERQSARIKWDTIRRDLLKAGCELVQWGVNVGEGCVRFDPKNNKQVAAVLEALK